MDRWLAEWGESRIKKVWAYLGENPSPWTEKKGARLGRLYGLFDTLEGQFQNGEPHRLCMMWVQVDAERLEKKRAVLPHFEVGDLVQVRDLTERFEVNFCDGYRAFFTDGRAAFATECRVVGKVVPPVVTAEDLVPEYVRRRAEAFERLAQRGIAR